MTPQQRRFLDGFLALARTPPPPEAGAGGEGDFVRLIVDRWPLIRWRVIGAVAARFAALDARQHRLLRLLEDTPSLLHPLGQQRKETSHSAMLAWALQRPGLLGGALRQGLAGALGVEVPSAGWLVCAESAVAGGCRVDIDVQLRGRWRCFIEVKVDAAERPGQLDDYRRALDAATALTGEDAALVLLTIDGRESGSDAQHRALSFRDLLVVWLPLSEQPGPDALVLRMWLVTIAREFYNLCCEGPVETWSLSQRRRVLVLLKEWRHPDA